jgi:pseudouridine-5'-phosphate glycosidase
VGVADRLVIAADVADALAEGRPVVALESTLISHGLPYPQNLEVATASEAAVRETDGAVPATVAVHDGRLLVGLDAGALAALATAPEGSVRKAARPSLALALAEGGWAATTVSATMIAAAAAGIRVFATGGIGGVHRGDVGDVSHDLIALAKTPIAVVSAGAKAILELPRTAELLETLGVLVIGYRTDELPAFYTRESGIRLEHAVGSPEELAAILRRHWDDLGGGGVLVANPIPRDAELDPRRIEAAIHAALAEAEVQGIAGKRLTPYLLARLADVTSGASIRANRALALHNAEVGAALALALAR